MIGSKGKFYMSHIRDGVSLKPVYIEATIVGKAAIEGYEYYDVKQLSGETHLIPTSQLVAIERALFTGTYWEIVPHDIAFDEVIG